MCGIAGWYCFGNERPTPEAVRLLLIEQQTRGRDAAGVAYLEDGGIKVRKAKGTATELAEALKELFPVIAQSPRGLLHARATTKGKETFNENNHPVVGPKIVSRWITVHNGSVGNDDDLFKFYSPNERYAEVDTAAIPLVLGQGTTPEDALSKATLLSGNVTAAAWSPDFIDTMLLFRLGGNAVTLILDQVRRILYWSSADGVAGKLPAHTLLGGVPMVTGTVLRDGWGMILTPTEPVTFRMERSPYFIPFAQGRTSHRTFSNIGNGYYNGGSIGGRFPPHRGTELTTNSDIKATKAFWERHDNFGGPGKLGPSSYIDINCLDWAQYNMHSIHAKFNENTDLQVYTLHTAYGRWIFTRVEGYGIQRNFAFRKNMKQVLFKALNEVPVFPVDAVRSGQYENKATLESLNLQRQYGESEVWHQETGFMCPWCGAIGRRTSWTTRSFVLGPPTSVPRMSRCEFCCIPSLIPEV